MRGNLRQLAPPARLRFNAILWGAVAGLSLALYPLVWLYYTPHAGNQPVDLPSETAAWGALITLLLLSSVFAFTAGFVFLTWFFVLGSRLYLIVGLGFCFAGTEDLLQGLISSRWTWESPTAVKVLTGANVASRVFLLAMFVFAFSYARRRPTPHRTRELLTFGGSAALVAVAFTCMAMGLDPSRFVYLDHFIARPVDLFLAVLFLTAVYLAIRHWKADPGPFQSSLVVSMILATCSQLYMCHWNQLFDVPFVIAHSMQVLSYVVPLFGAAFGLVQQQQLMSKQRQYMQNQTALLWRQSESLKQANSLLREQATQLQEVSRLKSEFLANMSHELRTPLNAIIGFSESLLDCTDTDPLTEWQTDRIGKIGTSGEHLLALINDLLDLAKVEAGKNRLRLSRFSAADVVDDVAGMLAPLFEKKPDVLFSTEVETDIPELALDRDKLGQILINLLSNAVKFTDAGSIELSVARQGDHIVFAVADTGIGISEENLDRIFEQFEQVDGGTTRKAAGTGLGLALVKRLSELMDGEVAVRSVVGRGSTFTVMLPLELEENTDERNLEVEYVGAT